MPTSSPLTAGQPAPHATLHALDQGQPRAVSTDQIFRNRTVAVFALPGAFTPTCSSQHLPRFEELAPDFRARGVDEIVCISVNDPYVMDAWARNQDVHAVKMLSDGNGAFTRAMGMLLDHSDQGMGQRSRRYSMLVRDGRIEILLAEPDVPGDPFTVSDADTLLRRLDPGHAPPPHVGLVSKPGCPHCANARRMLEEQGLRYTEVSLPDAQRGRFLAAVAGTVTAPQVFVDGERIGGEDDLARWLAQRGDGGQRAAAPR